MGAHRKKKTPIMRWDGEKEPKNVVVVVQTLLVGAFWKCVRAFWLRIDFLLLPMCSFLRRVSIRKTNENIGLKVQRYSREVGTELGNFQW